MFKKINVSSFNIEFNTFQSYNHEKYTNNAHILITKGKNKYVI